jgi:hypothetical protein
VSAWKGLNICCHIPEGIGHSMLDWLCTSGLHKAKDARTSVNGAIILRDPRAHWQTSTRMDTSYAALHPSAQDKSFLLAFVLLLGGVLGYSHFAALHCMQLLQTCTSQMIGLCTFFWALTRFIRLLVVGACPISASSCMRYTTYFNAIRIFELHSHHSNRFLAACVAMRPGQSGLPCRC